MKKCGALYVMKDFHRLRTSVRFQERHRRAHAGGMRAVSVLHVCEIKNAGVYVETAELMLPARANAQRRSNPECWGPREAVEGATVSHAPK